MNAAQVDHLGAVDSNGNTAGFNCRILQEGMFYM